MATKYYTFVGKAAWPKVKVPDETPWGKKWTIDLYPDADNIALIEESGVGLKPFKGETFPGETGYRFRRDVSKVINGEMQEFDPPVVTDVNNQPLEANIGNGSLVEVNVAVYDTRKGTGPKGHRMNSIKVIELVPYAGKESIRVAKNTSESPKVGKPW